MKLVRFSFLFALLIMVSCNSEPDELEQLEVNETIENEVTSSQTGRFNLDLPDDPADETEQLMYMTSFLVGRTLLADAPARDYFYAQMNQYGNTFGLSKVLSASPTNPNPFQAAFHTQFYLYNYDLDNGNTGGGPVSPPVAPNPPPDRWGGVLQMPLASYLGTVVNTYSWELHIPNDNVLTLYGYNDLHEYVAGQASLASLWSMDTTQLYTDGAILFVMGNQGIYLPSNYSVFGNPNLAIIVREQ